MTDSKKKHRIQCKGRPIPQQYKEIKAPTSSHTLLVLILLHPTCNLTTLQQECIVKPQLVLLVFLGATERYLGPKQSCPPCWPGPHAGLPWQEHASRQMFTPLQRTSPPGAEGGFSDAHANNAAYFCKAPSCCGDDIYINKCSIHLPISGGVCQLCMAANLGVLLSLMFLHSETQTGFAAPTSGPERPIIHQGSVLEKGNYSQRP